MKTELEDVVGEEDGVREKKRQDLAGSAKKDNLTMESCPLTTTEGSGRAWVVGLVWARVGQ